MQKYAISLRKNVRVADYADTSKGNYDAIAFKAFRKFSTRDAARAFKRGYIGQPVVIVNTITSQVVR